MASPLTISTLTRAKPEKEARQMEGLVNPALLPRVLSQGGGVQRQEEDRGWG
jgi:hypothetical protein